MQRSVCRILKFMDIVNCELNTLQVDHTQLTNYSYYFTTCNVIFMVYISYSLISVANSVLYKSTITIQLVVCHTFEQKTTQANQILILNL